nr:collagen alpha-1(I) chain-like [Kogia breviceps]
MSLKRRDYVVGQIFPAFPPSFSSLFLCPCPLVSVSTQNCWEGGWAAGGLGPPAPVGSPWVTLSPEVAFQEQISVQLPYTLAAGVHAVSGEPPLEPLPPGDRHWRGGRAASGQGPGVTSPWCVSAAACFLSLLVQGRGGVPKRPQGEALRGILGLRAGGGEREERGRERAGARGRGRLSVGAAREPALLRAAPAPPVERQPGRSAAAAGGGDAGAGTRGRRRRAPLRPLSSCAGGADLRGAPRSCRRPETQPEVGTPPRIQSRSSGLLLPRTLPSPVSLVP